ncbi:MAG: hypothetical protein AB7O44_27375 [Hyphomicrobiaceae bacterium]
MDYTLLTSTEGGPPAAETDADGVLGHFFWNHVVDEKRSQLEGKIVGDWQPFVRIITPNHKFSAPVEHVNDEHKRRWPKAWAAFEARQEGFVGGTPIEELPFLNRFQVVHLKSVGILSVEMLGGVADNNLDMVVTRDLRDRASQFLAGAGETEKQLRTDLADTQRLLKEALTRITTLEAALEAEKREGDDKPQRGRKAA